jgi:hypothetical protein
MRRFLLTLTIFSVPGWSQAPAQQPAQPPIVIKLEAPPTNPWVHLAEMVVPGIIGAGIAFLGVWWTNKRNAAENAANRQHQLKLEIAKDKIAAEAKSRDNRWAFRKDIYTGLMKATTNLIFTYSTIQLLSIALNDNSNPANEQRLLQVIKDLHEVAKDFILHVRLAPFAVADEVSQLAREAIKEITTDESVVRSAAFQSSLESKMRKLVELQLQLQKAGRKDLWDTPEEKAKDEAAT